MQDIFQNIGREFTLSQVIEKSIEEAIRQKKFSPGQKLPSEMELCSMFGVSRTALREALRMLSARGLVSIKKGSGIFINDFTSDHASKHLNLYFELNFDKSYIFHVVHVRQMVEPQVARLAAKNRTEKDLKTLEDNLTKLEQCAPDHEKEAELDLEFHRTIALASGNPIIPILLDPVFSLMPKIKTLIISHVSDAKTSAVEYHQKIIDNIKAQKEEGAYQAMTEHLKIAEEHSIKLLAAMERDGK